MASRELFLSVKLSININSKLEKLSLTFGGGYMSNLNPHNLAIQQGPGEPPGSTKVCINQPSLRLGNHSSHFHTLELFPISFSDLRKPKHLTISEIIETYYSMIKVILFFASKAS